jgi:hypothetical protein
VIIRAEGPEDAAADRRVNEWGRRSSVLHSDTVISNLVITSYFLTLPRLSGASPHEVAKLIERQGFVPIWERRAHSASALPFMLWCC